MTYYYTKPSKYATYSAIFLADTKPLCACYTKGDHTLHPIESSILSVLINAVRAYAADYRYTIHDAVYNIENDWAQIILEIDAYTRIAINMRNEYIEYYTLIDGERVTHTVTQSYMRFTSIKDAINQLRSLEQTNGISSY